MIDDRHTLISPEEIRKCQTKSGHKTLEDCRKVKFIYQELPEDAAFMSAQLQVMRSSILSY